MYLLLLEMYLLLCIKMLLFSYKVLYLSAFFIPHYFHRIDCLSIFRIEYLLSVTKFKVWVIGPGLMKDFNLQGPSMLIQVLMRTNSKSPYLHILLKNLFINLHAHNNLVKIGYADFVSMVINSDLSTWHAQIYLIYPY